MVYGGIAACLLACEIAKEEESTPLYTYYRSPTYPRQSVTASVSMYSTTDVPAYSTSDVPAYSTATPWETNFSTGMPR